MSVGSSPRVLAGVGPARERALAEAGVRTVGELLLHLPHRWEDRRSLASIGELTEPGAVTLVARLEGVRRLFTRRRRFSLVRGTAVDDSGRLPALWFNRPYLPRQVEEGVDYLLHGELRRGRSGDLELLNATVERRDRAIHAGRIVPVYPALGELGPAFVRRLVERALDAIDLDASFPDPLPERLRRRWDLPPLAEAVAALHRPPDDADATALAARSSPAHRRLIYGELLELQLGLGLLRRRQLAGGKPHRYRGGGGGLAQRLEALAGELLPFRLTAAQRRVVGEIVDDLGRPEPMLRLLQGDVGSGKTAVAALALVAALESGLQAALMAPTELLAEQHFRTLQRLLGDRWRCELLTASVDDAAAVRRRAESGESALLVGTHALIAGGVSFARLGLAVIDEQHRFGVAQRRRLEEKGERPDLLVMTATPIPRSLALTAYGDLDLSLIDELPPGRRPVATEVVPKAERRRVYAELRRAVAEGGQAYVVFPLIEESERVEAASLERFAERLQGYLGDGVAAVLHGRTPAEEREEIVAAFAAGRVRVLLTTTLIEVGVDVPAATRMVIESAERFGLAQLHQLRGRVGRGREASRCVAVHGDLTAEAERRLEVFAETTDGFRIAEADLEIRGPGELLGTRQAGVARLFAADLVRDRRWLERAREDARRELAEPVAEDLEPLMERVEERVEERLRLLAGG